MSGVKIGLYIRGKMLARSRSQSHNIGDAWGSICFKWSTFTRQLSHFFAQNISRTVNTLILASAS